MDNVVEKSDKPDNEEEELFQESTPFEFEDDEDSSDLDDEAASDLDIGVQVKDSLDADADGDLLVDLDLPGLIESAPDAGAGADDEAGPLEFDASMGIQEPMPENLEDSSLGFEELDILHLPESHASTSERDDQLLFNDWELELPDETSIERSGAPWHEVFRQSGRFETLLCAERRVFAGGEALLILEANVTPAGQEPRVVRVPSALVQLKPHPVDPDTLYAITRSGTLLALGVAGQGSSMTLDWRSALGPSEGPAATLSLACWQAGTDGMRVVALTSSGRLLELSPDALGFTPLSTSTRAVQLPTQSDRPALLGQSAQGICLLQSPGSGPFLAQPLDSQLARALALGPCELIISGPCIGLSGPRHGLLLSVDYGASFTRIPGCIAVTTSVLGSYLGSLHLWLTLSHEVTNQSELVLLDTTTLRVTKIAEFDTSDDHEFAPVQALAWDPMSQVLYAAGEFGLRGFAPAKGDA